MATPGGSHKVRYGLVGVVLALGAAVPFQKQWEGEPPCDANGMCRVFADPVYGWDVPTECYGDTGRDVKRDGPLVPLAECERRLRERDLKHVDAILADTCIQPHVANLPPSVLALLVSNADNLGVHAVCTSTMVRQINEGAAPEVYCKQLTQATARFVPFGKPVLFAKNGRPLPMAQQPHSVTVPNHGWAVARGRSCRDRRNQCYGLVRDAEQALCLGLPAPAP
jgi:GH24 family phage-related lysozyme (muramidase)